MNESTTYTLPEGLLQAIVNNLYAQPAAQSHQLLNGIEAVCTKQDQERAEAARLAEREAIKRELHEAQQPAAEAVQAPAQSPPAAAA